MTADNFIKVDGVIYGTNQVRLMRAERDALTRQLAEREKELAELRDECRANDDSWAAMCERAQAAEAQLADLQRSNGELGDKQ